SEQPPALSDFCNVPAPIERIVAKCLSKEPDDRYQSISELLQVLRSAQAGVEPSIAVELQDGTAKIAPGNRTPLTATTPAQPVQAASSANSSESSENNKQSEKKSAPPVAAIAIAVSALIGLGCATGIPMLLKKDSADPVPSVQPASVSTVSKPADSTATESSAAPSKPATAQSDDSKQKAEDPTKDQNNEEATNKEFLDDRAPAANKEVTTKPTGGQATKTEQVAPTSTKAEPTTTSTTTQPIPSPPAVAQLPHLVKEAPTSQPTKQNALGRTTTVQASTSPAMTNPPVQNEEQQRRQWVKDSLAEAKAQVDQLVETDTTWSLDLNSLDLTALENIGSYGINKISEAVKEICSDAIGKNSLKGKLRTISIKNLAKGQKKLSFHDGVLDVQASWSSGVWENYPRTIEVKEVIENGL
ncbi:MAG: hypothetical protein K2Z81_20760, partial [Cyanobacteria bacterium]|nr:hypothetical protein [Cyanobacteriota bacterium]